MRKICCFAGHRDIYNTEELSKRLTVLIEKLIIEENVTEFWVGHYGRFDAISSEAVKSIKNKYPDIELNLVIPYLTKVINEYREEYYAKYDNILIADIPEKTPKNLQILKCNEYMVKKSDFIICYIMYSWGGAAKTVEYAKKKKTHHSI